jgi:hypothetical protein
MKTVKILIEVEVPDNAKQVTVDENGEVWSYEYGTVNQSGKDDAGLGIWRASGSGCKRCRVSNWKETLTELDDGK